MFKKEGYNLETITRSTAKVPLAQAHLLLMLGVFGGGGTFLAGLLTNAGRLTADIEKTPEYVIMMIAGWMVFSFCFPAAYIVYLFKEVQSLKDKLEQINKT